MTIERRAFLTTGLAAFLVTCAERSPAQSRRVSPEDFGARGDGIADDTAALQACLDRAGPGGVIRLRPGAVYRVDTNFRPTRGAQGGIKLRARQVLELNGAVLRALPSTQAGGSVVQAFRSDGWQIRGPGRIIGERDLHQGNRGEWGIGVSAFSASGWSIGPGVEIANCWGDGILVASAGRGEFCHDFRVEGVRISDCRRNGISVVAGRGGLIRQCDISRINGVAPRGGIDLEPDQRGSANRGITIASCRIHSDVGVGVYATVANEDIELVDLDIEARNSGVIVSGRLNGLTISGSRIRSTRGGSEGAAIRGVGNPAGLRNIVVRQNQLAGGGLFVVDFLGRGYQGLVVTGNTITADQPGTRGVARIHSGTFTNNTGVIEARAGRPGGQFLHLQGATYGGNRYFNRSPFRMTAVHRGGRQVARDEYLSPSLIREAERL